VIGVRVQQPGEQLRVRGLVFDAEHIEEAHGAMLAGSSADGCRIVHSFKRGNKLLAGSWHRNPESTSTTGWQADRS
jgi:hypothetical protein